MVSFSLDLDDIEFCGNDELAWNFTTQEQHDKVCTHCSDPFQQDDLHQATLPSTTGDPLQGWLNQQLDIEAANKLAAGQNAAAPWQPSNTVTIGAQSAVQHLPRHDSMDIVQSMLSAASSSSRRGQRITGAYPCGQCDRVFDVPSDLKHHERKHITVESRPYACHYCGQRFLYLKDRSRHVQRKHKPVETFPELSRTQSMDEVPMTLADAGPVPAVDVEVQVEQSLRHALDAGKTAGSECTCNCGKTTRSAAGQAKADSLRFSESAIERLKSRLETLNRELMTLREERCEFAEAQTEEVAFEMEPNLAPMDTDGHVASPGTEQLMVLLQQQQCQIDRLKLEVRFATQDAVFWLEECNHHAWMLRKMPKAPRPPIYAVPAQAGRVSLVQYAQGWLGAIRSMFLCSDVESKDKDTESGLIQQPAGRIDRLSVDS